MSSSRTELGTAGFVEFHSERNWFTRSEQQFWTFELKPLENGPGWLNQFAATLLEKWPSYAGDRFLVSSEGSSSAEEAAAASHKFLIRDICGQPDRGNRKSRSDGPWEECVAISGVRRVDSPDSDEQGSKEIDPETFCAAIYSRFYRFQGRGHILYELQEDTHLLLPEFHLPKPIARLPSDGLLQIDALRLASRRFASTFFGNWLGSAPDVVFTLSVVASISALRIELSQLKRGADVPIQIVGQPTFQALSEAVTSVLNSVRISEFVK